MNDWQVEIVDKIKKMSQLKFNWDLYGAAEIRSGAIIGAVDFCSELNNYKLPKPEVVPTANGSVQFEWNRRDFAFEVEILCSNLVLIYYEDMVTREVFETQKPVERKETTTFIFKMIKRIEDSAR